MSNKDEIAYSNSPDFISAIKYIGVKQNIETEFFLNGHLEGIWIRQRELEWRNRILRYGKRNINI